MFAFILNIMYDKIPVGAPSPFECFILKCILLKKANFAENSKNKRNECMNPYLLLYLPFIPTIGRKPHDH